jgi:hypothetical protein
MAGRWATVMRLLARGPSGPVREIFNPYRDEAPHLDQVGAAARRRRNLSFYLEQVGEPEWILVGEAIGFRGGRFSGIAFTCERQFAAGERWLPWSTGCRPTSRNPVPWLEPSASIVWSVVGAVPRGVLLWNALPWHPYRRGQLLSNRRPEIALVDANLSVLERVLAASPRARPIAVGRTAQRALETVGVAAPSVRHPAYGGAHQFRLQLVEIVGRSRGVPVRRRRSAAIEVP